MLHGRLAWVERHSVPEEGYANTWTGVRPTEDLQVVTDEPEADGFKGPD